MTLTQNEVATRTPVWLALSNLYLDTPLNSAELKRIAGILRESPYSVEELRRILFKEVHPVCRGNLNLIAGNWSGFSTPELAKAIIANIDRRFKFPCLDFTKTEILGFWRQLSPMLNTSYRP